MNAISEISVCEVCGNDGLQPVLDLGQHPLCDDLIPVGNELQCQTYPIEILYCKQCDTAHQKFQVPKVTLFPQTYHYRSRFTADVLSGMAALVDSVEAQLNTLDGLVVLDVGCNDGSLLDKFSAKGARTIGVEPTGAYADAKGREHAIYNDYFNERLAEEILATHGKIDVITFTNVFAHIEDLPALLRSLAVLMDERTLLVVENHYLGAVLARNQFDTFYHEHPRTYTLNSFVHIAATLDRQVTSVDFPSRYGGNIRVMISKEAATDPAVEARINTTLAAEAKFYESFAAMRDFIAHWKTAKRQEIEKIVLKHGPMIAKAFPGRAAILVAMLNLDNSLVARVYEKPGSLKIGHYLPGTRIPIHSDDELFATMTPEQPILNLAWHIAGEIDSYLKQHGYTGDIIQILDQESN